MGWRCHAEVSRQARRADRRHPASRGGIPRLPRGRCVMSKLGADPAAAQGPRMTIRVPLRFLRGSRGRMVLTVIALAWGVSAVCGNDLVSRAALRAFREVVDVMVGRVDLRVSAGGGALLPKEVAITIARVPGVALVVPVVSATAFTADGDGEALAVHGMDLVDRAAAQAYGIGDVLQGRFRDPRIFLPGSVLITRPFAERRGLGVGRRLDLDTPAGRRPFTVLGVMEPQGLAR